MLFVGSFATDEFLNFLSLDEVLPIELLRLLVELNGLLLELLLGGHGTLDRARNSATIITIFINLNVKSIFREMSLKLFDNVLKGSSGLQVAADL